MGESEVRMRESERRSGWIRFGTGATAVVLGLAGCNPAPVNVVARRLAPLPVGSIRRIAVLPFTDARPVGEQRSLPGQEPLPEPPPDTVTRLVVDAMRRLPTWEIIDPLVRDEAFRRLYGEVRAPTPEEALAVGKLLGIDAVLRGQVTEFQERVGTEIAAEQPARVVFAVELLRVPSGPILWQAEYAETQRALSENLWNLGGFLHLGAKWVRASELAAVGADQVAKRLHETLFGEAASEPESRGGASGR